MPLSLGLPAAGTYTLRADTLSNLPAGLDAYLVDLTTGQQQNLRQQRSLSLTLTAAQVAQPLTGRFVLRFGAAGPLAAQGHLSAADVAVYPNPSQGSFRVLLPAVPGATQARPRCSTPWGSGCGSARWRSRPAPASPWRPPASPRRVHAARAGRRYYRSPPRVVE